MPELYDIVLANGRVIAPETYTDAVLNIGINDATIVAISKEPLKRKMSSMRPERSSILALSNRVQRLNWRLEAGVLPISEFYKNNAEEGYDIKCGASAGWGFARQEVLQHAHPEPLYAGPEEWYRWYHPFDGTHGRHQSPHPRLSLEQYEFA
jgi:hypothetical protein